MSTEKNRVCPVELAGSLDNKIRKWFQNPNNILAPYVKEGMKVLDIGCGPGFFSIEIAKMVGINGKVFAVDLQEGMLQKIRDKISGTMLESIITPVKCEKDNIPVPEKVDFILAFYMVHEVPDKDLFFETLKKTLLENGEFLIVEPKMFHVSKAEFALTLEKGAKAKFKVYPGPKLPFSFSALLKLH